MDGIVSVLSGVVIVVLLVIFAPFVRAIRRNVKRGDEMVKTSGETFLANQSLFNRSKKQK